MMGTMQVGDTVRLKVVPLDVKDQDDLQTRTLFQKCIDKCFVITDIEHPEGVPFNLLRLEVGGVVGLEPWSHVIWVEECLVDKVPKPGSTVILLELPPGFVTDLPAQDQESIRGILGKPVLLNEYDDAGRAELEFTDPNGVSHLIYVSPQYITSGGADE